jgi:hypothetical protein
MMITMNSHELVGIVTRAILHNLKGVPGPLDRFLTISDLLVDEGKALRYAVLDYLPACQDYLRGRDDPRVDEARRRIGRLGGKSRMYYYYQRQTFIDVVHLLAPDAPPKMADELALGLWSAWLKRIEKPALRWGRAGPNGP